MRARSGRGRADHRRRALGAPMTSLRLHRDKDRLQPQRHSLATNVAALSDAALIERIRQKQRDAFRELYGRYSPAAWRLARATAGPDLAADVVCEVFVDLWYSPHLLHGESRDHARLPVVCRLLDAVIRRGSDPRRRAVAPPGATRLGGMTSRERAALILVVAGATRDQAGLALGETREAIARLLRRALTASSP